MSCLRTLGLDACAGLTRLPESFGTLPALEFLRFNGCRELASLPGTFGSLTKLQSL